jgi:hypothetical protein
MWESQTGQRTRAVRLTPGVTVPLGNAGFATFGALRLASSWGGQSKTRASPSRKKTREQQAAELRASEERGETARKAAALVTSSCIGYTAK